MTKIKYFDPKETTELFGLKENFLFLKKLILRNQLPKVLLISGEKGIGKSTLINHLMYFYFDKKNYDEDNHILKKKDIFHRNFIDNLFPNIYYLNGHDFKNIKLDDIRKLKNDLSKTSINKLNRFIILDDVETFNSNSLNALLKIIEEPRKNDFFILINNKSNSLLETVKSRCLEIKLLLKDKDREVITSSLIKYFNQNIMIDSNLVKISPGNFLKFNYLLKEKKLNINDNFFFNLNKILLLYKKEKSTLYKDLSIFLIEYFIQTRKMTNLIHNEKLINDRSFLIKNINDFFIYNLNQNTLINSIEGKFADE